MVAAAVAWLATLLELAATSIRFVIAMSPKTRITIATSASTSVKPACDRLAGCAPAGLGTRFFMWVSVMAGSGHGRRC